VKIGELAKRSGLAQSRIRFYESIGLLKTVDRRPNGYRIYPPEAALVLELIATAQKAGFSLDEIRSLLPTDSEHWEHDALLGTLKAKVTDIEALEARLAQSKARLVSLIGDIEAKPEDIDCLSNARRVLAGLFDPGVPQPELVVDDVRLLEKSDRRHPIKSSKAGRAHA